MNCAQPTIRGMRIDERGCMTASGGWLLVTKVQVLYAGGCVNASLRRPSGAGGGASAEPAAGGAQRTLGDEERGDHRAAENAGREQECIGECVFLDEHEGLGLGRREDVAPVAPQQRDAWLVAEQFVPRQGR